jgi:hypothetical protein
MSPKVVLTCHHCICELDEIYIERGGDKFRAWWDRSLSSMEKDIPRPSHRVIAGVNAIDSKGGAGGATSYVHFPTKMKGAQKSRFEYFEFFINFH